MALRRSAICVLLVLPVVLLLLPVLLLLLLLLLHLRFTLSLHGFRKVSVRLKKMFVELGNLSFSIRNGVVVIQASGAQLQLLSDSETMTLKVTRPHGQRRFLARLLRLLHLLQHVQVSAHNVNILPSVVTLDALQVDTAVLSLRLKTVTVVQCSRQGGGAFSDASGNFRFEHCLSLDCICMWITIDYERDVGYVVKQISADCGDAKLYLNVAAVETVPQSDLQEIIPVERYDPDPEYAATVLARRIPDAISLTLGKVTMETIGSSGFPCVRNELEKIDLRAIKTQPVDAVDVISLLDIQLDVGEIQLLQLRDKSLLEVGMVSIDASLQFPRELVAPLWAGVDVKLLGTRINIDMSKCDDLMQLSSIRLPQKKKKRDKSAASTHMITSLCCGISAPDMEMTMYTQDQRPLMQVVSQTSHLQLNVDASQGVVFHAELGDVLLKRIEGKMVRGEFLLGDEDCADCLLSLSKISVDSTGENPGVLMIEAGAAEAHVGMANLQAVSSALAALQPCLKKKEKKKIAAAAKHRGIKFDLQVDRLVLHLEQKMIVENSSVADRKKATRVTSPRTARVKASDTTGAHGVKQKLAVNLFHLAASFDTRDKSAELQLKNGHAFYEEVAADGKTLAEKMLLVMHDAKMIRKPATIEQEAATYTIFRAEKVLLEWDPDVHLLLFEQSLRFKELFGAAKVPKATTLLSSESNKVCYALDIQEGSLKAQLAHGVEATVSAHTLFTDDIAFGILCGELEVALNKATVAKADRLQVSRVPAAVGLLSQLPLWDLVVHGAGICLTMPYRLPLRGIEDAAEESWRGLKLAMAAKRDSMQPKSPKKPKTRLSPSSSTSSFRLNTVQVHIMGIRAEVEEEPLQGWLDEHYRAMQQQAQRRLAQEKLLEGKHLRPEQARHKAWEQLQERSFLEYKKFCSELHPGTGSGACNTGWQGGFRPSAARTSLMSISADHLQFELARLQGGRSGMVETVRRLDSVQPDVKVPFSRLNGGHVQLHAAHVAVRIRDYEPLLSATSVSCRGTTIFAQQATCSQKQVPQRIYVGRWRTVEMLRSAPGTTPPLKVYSELDTDLQNTKVCFGVGYEPALVDLSYAFGIALRRAQVGVKQPRLGIAEVVKKEKSLPWFDDLRYYVHGSSTITCRGFELSVLAERNPYELSNRMRMESSTVQITKTEGALSFQGNDFDVYISNSKGRQQHKLIHAPVFRLDVSMLWTCASGDPLNHYLHSFPSEQQSRELVYSPFRSLTLSLVSTFSLESSAQTRDSSDPDAPVIRLGADDLAWILRLGNLYSTPPCNARKFIKFARFGVQKMASSGNRSLDKVLSELLVKVESTSLSVQLLSRAKDRHPAPGMVVNAQDLLYELCFRRANDSKLDLIDQRMDARLLTVRQQGNNAGLVLSAKDLVLRKQMNGSPTSSSSSSDDESIWSVQETNAIQLKCSLLEVKYPGANLTAIKQLLAANTSPRHEHAGKPAHKVYFVDVDTLIWSPREYFKIIIKHFKKNGKASSIIVEFVRLAAKRLARSFWSRKFRHKQCEPAANPAVLKEIPA